MGKFTCTTTVFWGTSIKERVTRIEQQTILIVCDRFLETSPLFKEYTTILSKKNHLTIFSDVVPDPPLDNIIAGIDVYRKTAPTFMFAFGGGSAIDTAKAIYYFAQKLRFGQVQKFIAIPTTSGTGSEVTSVAVVTEKEKNSKYPIASESLSPDEAWLDARFVASCPPSVTASSGLDVLTHALEALVAKEANPFTDGLALHAAQLVFTYLPQCYAAGTSETAYMTMHQASCAAGIAFQNAGLGICHAISHQLGGTFHLPHGLLNSMLLPYVIQSNCQAVTVQKKYAAVARTLKIADEQASDRQAVRRLVEKIEQLKQAVGSVKSLKDFGINQRELLKNLQTMVQKTKNDFTYAGNPRVPTDQEIAKIILSVY